MAVVKTILKKTHQEAVVKVSGTAATATISLASDLLPTNQALTSGGTPRVNIIGAHWTGANGCAITITRNSVVILNASADQPTNFDFEGLGFVDNVENASDIEVAVSGASGQIYLQLRKVDGYSTKIEYADFGQYDDPTAVGS